MVASRTDFQNLLLGFRISFTDSIGAWLFPERCRQITICIIDVFPFVDILDGRETEESKFLVPSLKCQIMIYGN